MGRQGAAGTAATAATLVVLLVAAVGCGSRQDDVASTAVPAAQASAVPLAPGAVWPSRIEQVLADLQGLADRGRRPDLLDPVAVARDYLAAGLPAEAARVTAGGTIAVGTFTRSGPTTGEVPVSGAGMSGSTVYLHSLAGAKESAAGRGAQRPIWYVLGVGSPDLAVLDIDYDGQRLTGALIPGRDGQCTVRVTGLDGDVVSERTVAARAQVLLPLDVAAPGQPALVVAAALLMPDGTVAPREFRIGAPAG